ncbi:hypothetical protein LCGC14_1135880 [marine sediment metagenome]|uniref:Uncharacterized protein n=1 Tax=marine sediment metagenome TaxID=412755 RepID=A0A0F9Q5G1_9ZZZZ
MKAEDLAKRMTDTELADELIARLNTLIEDEEIREAVEQLCLRQRAKVHGTALATHPTIQVSLEDDDLYNLGFLGLLNGVVGAIPEGEDKGCGYIAALYDFTDAEKTDMKLTSFKRFDTRGYKINES